VGGVPFQTMVTLAEGQRRIEFQVRFNCEQETWIGDPWGHQAGGAPQRTAPVFERRALEAAGVLPGDSRQPSHLVWSKYSICLYPIIVAG
jgi:hypothetical protein